MKLLAFLIFILPAACFGTELAPNWTGAYAPCNNHQDLLTREHVNLGVRISTANPVLAQQFQKAMEFWKSILNIDWHEVNSQDCSLQVVDGTPALFNWCACMSARSQLPDRADFEGWIAFNPRLKLSKQEMFLDSVHEIGHLLGLAHNPSDASVMFFFGLDKTASLDVVDLDALALKHTLRPGIRKAVPVTVPRTGFQTLLR